MQKLPSLVLICGFTVLVASIIIGWMIVPRVIESKISQQVRLVNGSETFQRWQNVTVPIYVRFYLFNITNPNEVAIGKKPMLQEVGPYTFLQKRRKVDVKFHEENDTVSYRQIMSYFFQPNLSNGSLNDTVIMMNLPLLSTAASASKKHVIARSLIVEYTTKEKTFVYKTVDEMLFKGYYEQMMEELASFSGQRILINDTFGLQYGKNNTDQGLYEVYTGVQDGSKFGEIASWNGSPDMPWWDDENCKKIKGTDGSIFPPFVETDRKLDMFSADLCRTIRLLYEKESEVHGIPSYKFTVDEKVLQNPILNRDNMCYCTDQGGDKFENCPKDGAYQLNACKKGSPILVSLPHFLDGSEEYLNKVDGLHADRKLHETFVEVEPSSGLLLRAHKRIQINVEVKSYKFIRQFKKLPTMLLPVFWMDESVEVPESSAERIQGKLLRPKAIAQMGSWGGILLGLLIIAIAAVIYLIRARRKKYST